MAVAMTIGCGGSGGGTPPPVTYNDVAPILDSQCAACHRPGGSAPFGLLDYDHARRRARQIVEVTRSGYMPPWLPATGPHRFAGERRLDEDALHALERWVEDGVLEGEPQRRPPRPEFADGWVLGTPDLVLSPSGPYVLPEEGRDVYRNFVLTPDLDAVRWVAAVEFRPGNAKIVHHGRLLIDPTRRSRREDARDEAPGFDDMSPGSAVTPDGMLLGWTPGRLPLAPAPGMAWRLDPGTDVVLQLHLVPSGKPEPIRPEVALHFADAPPTLHPFTFVLGSRRIDIPPGARAYAVEDSYRLPVDVELLGIYPHAHYLATEMHARAIGPEGEITSLLHIPQWDFNWQDEYRYVAPVPLPRGTRIEMRYLYDNSSDNVFNPHDPPRRVTYGASTSDEMAELMLQVLPGGRAERDALDSDFERKKARDAIAFREERLRDAPDEPEHHAALGSSWQVLGEWQRAEAHYREALRLTPGDPIVHNNLGWLLRETGRPEQAVEEFAAAVRLRPDLAEAQLNLGETLLSIGRAREALVALRAAVELERGSATAHQRLASALRANGDSRAAVVHLHDALRVDPQHAAALVDLAWLLATDPARREPQEAVALAERARDVTEGGDERVLGTLAAAYASAGRFDRAVETGERAVALALAHDREEEARELRRHVSLYRGGEAYRPAER